MLIGVHSNTSNEGLDHDYENMLPFQITVAVCSISIDQTITKNILRN